MPRLTTPYMPLYEISDKIRRLLAEGYIVYVILSPKRQNGFGSAYRVRRMGRIEGRIILWSDARAAVGDVLAIIW